VKTHINLSMALKRSFLTLSSLQLAATSAMAICDMGYTDWSSGNSQAPTGGKKHIHQ